VRIACGLLTTVVLAVGLLAAPDPGRAATIAYWRMEVDDDPSASGLSVPNEVAGGSPLVSSEALLDGSNLPLTLVPQTTAPNDFSVAAAAQGAAAGINASAAWTDTLAVTSISVEFWGRTLESTATPFRFSSGGADGIVMTDPNGLDVTWHVDVGGVPTAFTFSDLDDMDASWSHYAFVYDETNGHATFWIDGVVAGFLDGPDGSPLVIVPGTPVELGVLMDYASAGQGTLDEVRIDGTALPATALLPVPEPTTALTLGLGLAVLAAHRQRERRAARDRAAESDARTAGDGWQARALSARSSPRPSPPRPGAGRPASGA